MKIEKRKQSWKQSHQPRSYPLKENPPQTGHACFEDASVIVLHGSRCSFSPHLHSRVGSRAAPAIGLMCSLPPAAAAPSAGQGWEVTNSSQPALAQTPSHNPLRSTKYLRHLWSTQRHGAWRRGRDSGGGREPWSYWHPTSGHTCGDHLGRTEGQTKVIATREMQHIGRISSTCSLWSWKPSALVPGRVLAAAGLRKQPALAMANAVGEGQLQSCRRRGVHHCAGGTGGGVTSSGSLEFASV